ncbi:MAG: DUF3793 family protein [Treponema sp.]|jgi:hypothetical protein|nr:DUF3793 family protein [Treponema sp.]
MNWVNALRFKTPAAEIERVIINQCGPILMGDKPSAVFPLQSEICFAGLTRLLPPNIQLLTLRKNANSLLVMAFDKNLLEKTLSNKKILTLLAGMGYPAGVSVYVLLDYLKNRFHCEDFPHEVGFFLGFPVEDVLGFVKHRGQNYKLCGYWKVYGNVSRAKECFRKYDFCRERMKIYFHQLKGAVRTSFSNF